MAKILKSNIKDNVVIELKDLEKVFGEDQAIKGVNLQIKEGEFVTLLGPSGCGKSTTLRMIAGFEEATNGQILLDGKSIIDIPPNKRPLNTVFQDYSLFPHLNVKGNLLFPLKNNKELKLKLKEQGVDIKQEFSKMVSETLSLVGLDDFEDRDVHTLSGGQKQRVAIARAIINKPRVLLLDEPLGALDLKLRKKLQWELKQLQMETGITFVFVTHDQEEAMVMSDKIVVLNNGSIEQIGTPVEIYNEPENKWVAEFIGDSNIIEAQYVKDEVVSWDKQSFKCVDKGFKIGSMVDVVVRPEDIDVSRKQSAGSIPSIITSRVFMGLNYEYDIECSSSKREYLVQTIKKFEVGEKVYLNIDPFEIHVMEKEI